MSDSNRKLRIPRGRKLTKEEALKAIPLLLVATIAVSALLTFALKGLSAMLTGGLS